MKILDQNLKKLIKAGVYNKEDEHDACGVGFVASIDGKPRREVVENGIEALKAVWHRGAVDKDGKTGDISFIKLMFIILVMLTNQFYLTTKSIITI